jgi:hypothetical protein
MNLTIPSDVTTRYAEQFTHNGVVPTSLKAYVLDKSIYFKFSIRFISFPNLSPILLEIVMFSLYSNP